MVAGDAPIMEATLTTRVTAEACRKEAIFETYLAPLQNAQRISKF